MSYVLLAVGAGAGLYLMSRRSEPDPKDRPEKHETDDTDKTINSGKYGTIAELGEIADMPYVFVREEKSVDLSGVPMRWLVTQTGRRYSTYDMIHPSAQMPLPDSYWDSEIGQYSGMQTPPPQVAALIRFREDEARKVHAALERLRTLPSGQQK